MLNTDGKPIKKYSLLIIIIAFFLLTGCDSENSQENVARTYYESLNLDTPETAVKVFANSFQRQDYYTIYLILSPTTQRAIANNINTLHYAELIKLDQSRDAREILADTPQFQVMDKWEHATSIYFFDAIMLAARQHSAFLIDLSEDVSILHSEPRSDLQVDVHTNVEGVTGDVIFRMEQSPSGRWRVRQVIVPGGDEDLLPWSVPRN